MNKRHFDALEACLQALEQGETLDAALARFPALADDLRPILQASLHARTLAAPPPSDAVQRRGRARLLQRAAEMREAKVAPRRTWVFRLRPVAVAFLLIIFLLSGTGLVRASSAALPGDNLYPVKRAWEGARLLFAFSTMEREGLEMEYENERLEEVRELLARGRIERVSFSGYVTSQKEGRWMISGIPVQIGAQTILPAEPISARMAVTVYGLTTLQGYVEASRVEILPPGVFIPPPESEEQEENGEATHVPTRTSTPTAIWTATPTSTPAEFPSQLPAGNVNGNENEKNENDIANDNDNNNDNDDNDSDDNDSNDDDKGGDDD